MEQIYQHFKESEQGFINQVLDDISRVQMTHTPSLTPFMNPRERYIVQSIVSSFDDVKYSEAQEISTLENNRGLIYPYYSDEPRLEDFEMALLEVEYPQKFARISHGQILGTVLGSGIVRDRLGDIITDGKRWQFFIDENLKDYIKQQVTRIGKTSVHLKECSFNELIEPEETGISLEIVVSSLRIDSVISRAFNMSRQLAQELIKKNRVKINWADEIDPAMLVEKEDIISVRTKGRVRIGEVKNRTKKDNIILKIIKYDRNQK